MRSGKMIFSVWNEQKMLGKEHNFFVLGYHSWWSSLFICLGIG